MRRVAIGLSAMACACGDATLTLAPDAAAPDQTPPGARDDGAVYIPFDTLPLASADGTALGVAGGDAALLPGAVGQALHASPTTVTYAGADIALGDFTIALWIRPSTLADQPILDKRIQPSPAVYRGYFLGIQSSKIVFQMANKSLPTEVYYSAGQLRADCDWHWVVVTVNRKETFGGRLYVDAVVLRTFVDADGTLVNDAPLRIGSEHFDGVRFDGAMDELVIAPRALTEAEITDYYARIRASLPPPTC